MAKEAKVVESSEMKFSDDELQSLQDLQNGYQEKQGTMNFWNSSKIQKQQKPFEVDYCGFGFTKVSTEILKQMEYPYFRQRVVEIGKYKENVSEDASFCLDVAELTDIKPTILPQLRINHLKELYI